MELLPAHVLSKLAKHHNDIFTVAEPQLNTSSLVVSDSSVALYPILLCLRFVWDESDNRGGGVLIVGYSLNRPLMSL